MRMECDMQGGGGRANAKAEKKEAERGSQNSQVGYSRGDSTLDARTNDNLTITL